MLVFGLGETVKASPNLIINGDFPLGATGGWTSRSAGTVLEISNSTGTYGVATAPTPSGYFCEVEKDNLSPKSTPDYIQQTVTTKVGETYLVSIYAATRSTLDSNDRLIIYADGTNSAPYTASNTGNPAPWHFFQSSFAATQTSSVIRYVSDGSATGYTQPGDSVGVMVTGAQVQELTIAPAAASTTEDTAVTLSGFNSATNTTAASMSAALSVTNGKITLLSTTGLTFTTGSNNSNSFTISGTPAAVSAALGSTITYTPTPDFNGISTLSLTVTAGTASDTDTTAITVAPVADIVADTVTTNENASVFFNPIIGTNGTNPDNFEGATPVISALSMPGNGTASFSGNTVTYTPNPGFSGTDSFTYTVTSGGVTETATITVTVLPSPRLTLRKISQGGPGSFTFTGNNGWTSQVINAGPAGATGATQKLTLANSITTIVENVPAGYTLLSASCTGLGTGGTASLSGATLTLNSAATASGANIVCTFTNRKNPVFKLQKTTTGGSGGPFTFGQTNLASSIGAITTTAANTATPSSPASIEALALNTAITVTENVASGFIFSSASCTDANAAITGNTGSFGTVSGTTLTIPASRVVAGADFTCLFTNQKGLPNLVVLKSANTAGPVVVGQTVTYTYNVTNTGNVPITGITLLDTHNGNGTFNGPANETLSNDVAPTGDTVDGSTNGYWDALGPGDSVTFTANYVVTQWDIDHLQ